MPSAFDPHPLRPQLASFTGPQSTRIVCGKRPILSSNDSITSGNGRCRHRRIQAENRLPHSLRVLCRRPERRPFGRGWSGAHSTFLCGGEFHANHHLTGGNLVGIRFSPEDDANFRKPFPMSACPPRSRVSPSWTARSVRESER